MGKRRWQTGIALLMAAVLQATATQAAERTLLLEEMAGNEQGARLSVAMNDERRIEQAYCNLPEVSVYGEGFTIAEVEAGEGYLSEEKLTLVSAAPFSETGEGIFYYVMLDISGSIPGSYFRSVKEGIKNLQDSLGEKDHLVLCTFGETVTLAADGSQTSEEMSAVLAGLKNKDQETLLFEGIDKVAALTDQTRGECRRQVLLVISDGEDFATGKKMSQEALAALKEKGFPAYAVCIQDTEKENINSFGEFARTSGGLLRTFRPEEGAGVLTEIADGLQDDICVRYRASSNMVTNKEENFSFQFADGSVLSRAVMNVHWIPDHEAPRLVSGGLAGERQISLSFNEPMSGAAGAADYKVTVEGREIGVTSVAYGKEDATQVILTLAEDAQNGTYEIACANLTDHSMEKNPLEGSIQVVITGVMPKESEASDTGGAEGDYTGILFLILIAMVALIILVLVLSSKKKKAAKNREENQEENQDGGVSQVELPDRGFKGHVVLGAAQKRMLNVIISAKGRQPRQTTWELGSSLIVGRASTCDVTVEDLEMSRQHFCLEWKNESIYVTDLGSTNGTSINGIRIQNTRRLEPGDYIEAGSVKFTIRW